MKKEYIFDAILVTSTLPEVNDDSAAEGGGRVYSIRLFDDFEELPSERLFVENFPDGPGLAKFTATPCELIGSLSSRGVCIGLSENEELLAAGHFMLGPTILRQLTDPTFCVTQSVMVDLTKVDRNQTVTVCTVELIVKISATDPDVDQALVSLGTYDVCRPAAREIAERDIIFTLGRSGKCGVSTCITDERLMKFVGAPNPCPHAPPIEVDSKGGAVPGCGCFVGAMKTPNAEKEAKNKERDVLKKLTEELGLDEVKVPSPPAAFEMSRRRTQAGAASTSSSDTTSSCGPNDFLPPKKAKALSLSASMEQQARRRNLGPLPIGEPELKTEAYKPPQLCQLCQSDISWLPKISACPYCGYKAFEDLPASEEPYDLTATAAQLLRDCLRKETCQRGSSSNDAAGDSGMGDGAQGPGQQSSSDPNVSKRCLCMDGKACTRCRIRKLCNNFMKNSEVKKQLPLPQAEGEAPRGSKAQAQAQGEAPRGSKAQGEAPVQGQELQKTNSSASQRRSQLVSIFTEMRNIYGREEGASEAEKQRQECDALCRGTTTAKARRKAQKALQKTLDEIDKAYPSPTKKRVKKRAPRPKSKLYAFLKVHKKPTESRIGHTDCIKDGACSGYCKVPCHMGWMWTKSEMARYKSWRPGAIARPIRQLMAYFLNDFPADTICLSRYHYLRRKGHQDQEAEEEEPLVQHPTLHISRKGDEFIITLRPLKDPKSLLVSADPYVDMKPVVFRITKDPVAAGFREMRVSLQQMGFPPCTCGRPVATCFCRSHVEKKRIQYQVEEHCRRRGWPDHSADFVYSPNSDDEDSDREYEFGVTPPAGVIKPERLKGPDRANAETQYEDYDWASLSMYPHPPNMMVQYGACVMGERKKLFPWLMGKGRIHAPPKKPIMINRAKKVPRKRLPF